MLTMTHLFGFVAFRRNSKAVTPIQPISQAEEAEEADLLAGWSPVEKAKRQRHISANRQLAEHLGLANVARRTPDRANW